MDQSLQKILFIPIITMLFTPNLVMAQEQTRGWVRSSKSTQETQLDNRSLIYDKSYALLIGASNYKSWPQLSHVESELDDVQEALEAQEFQVTRLADPSGENLRRGIEKFISDYGYDVENRLLIFYSGHGHSIKEKGFLVPVDAPPDEDLKGFRRKALPMTQVLAWARDIEAKHVLFLFDSCFSGTIFTSRSMSTVRDSNLRKAMSLPVRQFITAGGEKDEVPAKSTFTPMFVKAVNGAGDLNSDGYVTGSELGLHLSQQVPRYVGQTPQYGKIRDHDLSQGDFVFAVQKKRIPKAAGPQTRFANRASKENAKTNESLELALDLELWQSAKEFGDKSDYEAYLQEFPNGKFARMARNRIGVLSNQMRASNKPTATQELSTTLSSSETFNPSVTPNPTQTSKPAKVNVGEKKPFRRQPPVVVKPANNGWQAVVSKRVENAPPEPVTGEAVWMPIQTTQVKRANTSDKLTDDELDWKPIRSTSDIK